MTTLTWATLGAGLLLLPLGDPVVERVRLLGARGRLRSPRSHARRLELAGLRLSRGRALALGGAALAVVTVRAGPVLGAAAGLAVAAVGSLVRGIVRARGAERSAARLLASVRVMLAELAAGATPETALRAAGEADPTRADTYGRAAELAGSGTDAGPILRQELELAPVGHAWSVASVTGAPIGAVLDRVVADLVARREHARTVAGALAGPRSSAVVLAALPAVGILLGVAMDAHPLAFLFGSTAGQLVCLAGVGLDVAGLLWTRRLAAGAAP